MFGLVYVSHDFEPHWCAMLRNRYSPLGVCRS